MLPIIVVCIDHCKWSVYLIDGAQNSVCSSPWFLTPFRYGKALRDIIDILISIGNFHIFLNSVTDCLFKIILILFFDNKDNFLKSRALCIINGKIHYDMPFLIYGIDLFEAAVSAAHTCCHNDKNRFFHVSVILLIFSLSSEYLIP